MTNTEAIFIFTRDRPGTLSQTLQSISSTPYPKFIIDDSTHQSNQTKVATLSAEFENCKYLGKNEFQEFCATHKINFPQFSFLLRELGSSEWNLGYARNFALMYAKAARFERVLFTDDDIQVPQLNIIEELFANLSTYKFTGANIEGLVDDSALGHIATSVQVTNERMLSGGFMAFSPNKIDQFFLNNYNEDWIWLFLQLKNDKHLQTGEVFQALSDPLANYTEKIIFQEFGEIALDGILDLHQNCSYDSLTDLSFWQRMIEERREYLTLLEHKSKQTATEKNFEIISWVKSNSDNLNAELFQELFENYFMNRLKFLKLFELL